MDSEALMPTYHKIAVVGMSVWYPGAQSMRQFWENILTKRSQFREMLDQRLPSLNTERRQVGSGQNLWPMGSLY